MINRRKFLKIIILFPLGFIFNDFRYQNKIFKSNIVKSKNVHWILSKNDN